MALNDARLLLDALADNDDLVSAVGSYEEQMRQVTIPSCAQPLITIALLRRASFSLLTSKAILLQGCI